MDALSLLLCIHRKSWARLRRAQPRLRRRVLREGWNGLHGHLLLAILSLLPGRSHAQNQSPSPKSATTLRAGALSVTADVSNHRLANLQLRDAISHRTFNLHEAFVLSGPKYYQLFQQTCLEMIDKYHVNQFKFDGTGNANRVFPGSAFDSDFDAAIHLIEPLRQQKPSIFVNLTTGTTASPFWLFYADSIWRGGDNDHDFSGVGTPRQRWITYRDAQTYKNIVLKGPLFPLNSLMLHGLIYARHAKGLSTDLNSDFADEVHSYFGTGTQLQEMYITPSLLTKANWDTLAEAARWSRAHAATLKDVHWIGGAPDQLQIYGWAAWSPREGIITLRNPSTATQPFTIDVAKLFELQPTDRASYKLHSVWNDSEGWDRTRVEEAHADKPLTISLAPFEVLTLSAIPTR
jgi:hypothetical protein